VLLLQASVLLLLLRPVQSWLNCALSWLLTQSELLQLLQRQPLMQQQPLNTAAAAAAAVVIDRVVTAVMRCGRTHMASHAGLVHRSLLHLRLQQQLLRRIHEEQQPLHWAQLSSLRC
jgi:hypothetical protein